MSLNIVAIQTSRERVPLRTVDELQVLPTSAAHNVYWRVDDDVQNSYKTINDKAWGCSSILSVNRCDIKFQDQTTRPIAIPSVSHHVTGIGTLTRIGNLQTPSVL